MGMMGEWRKRLEEKLERQTVTVECRKMAI
jgi:hypothetical protein